MDAVVGGEDLEEVKMEDGTGEECYQPLPEMEESFTPSQGGADTLVHQNEKGDLVGPEGSAKSVDEYLNCRLCQLKFDAVKDAMLHYSGETHKEILSALAETQGLIFTKKEPAKGGKRKAPAESESNKAKKLPGLEGIGSGIFVDDNGCLWGTEKNAETLGEFKSCGICSITASSFKTAKEHYNGNKHNKMMKRTAEAEGLEYKSVGKKLYSAVAQGPIERDDDPMGLRDDMRTQVHKEAAAEKEEGELSNAEGEKQQDADTEKPDDSVLSVKDLILKGQIRPNSDIFCWTCMAVLTSKQTADLHYVGKKHAKVVAQLQYGQDVTKHGKPILDLAGSGVLYCTPCDVMCITRDQLDEHFAGEEHKAVLDADKKRQEEAKKALSGDLGYGCRICNVRLNSKQTYIEHQESKKHLKKYYAKHGQTVEEGMGFPGHYPPGEFHGPFGWRGPDFGRRGHDFGRRGHDFGRRGHDFGRRGHDFGRMGPDFGRMGPDFDDGWDRQRPPWEDAGPPFGRGRGRWEGGEPWEDRGPHFGRGGPGRWKGDKPGRFPYTDVRKDGGAPSNSELAGVSEMERIDFSKVGSSGEDLSETLLNLLPKEALLKLAMEALASKSKELVKSGSDMGVKKKDNRGEQGETWNEDEDYKSYEWEEKSGIERGFPRRGRGSRGFERGREQHFEGGRDMWEKGHDRFRDDDRFGGHERGRGFGRGGRGFGRGLGRGLGRARGGRY